MNERIIYEVEVPQDDRESLNDTPDAYRVVECDGVPTCMVYGLYSRFREQPEWVANPTTRWLVKHLLGIVGRLQKTANGVPIVQDTDYWLANDWGEPIKVHTDRSGPKVMCRDGVYRADEMYSSKESAERARNQSNG